jgi:hypothetical protein
VLRSGVDAVGALPPDAGGREAMFVDGKLTAGKQTLWQTVVSKEIRSGRVPSQTVKEWFNLKITR